MPKIICQTDLIQFQPHENGVYVVDMCGDPPHPYKVWHADTWQCPICHQVVAAGFGQTPLREHYENGFDEWFAKIKASGETIIVNYEHVKDSPTSNPMSPDLTALSQHKPTSQYRDSEDSAGRGAGPLEPPCHTEGCECSRCKPWPEECYPLAYRTYV